MKHKQASICSNSWLGRTLFKKIFQEIMRNLRSRMKTQVVMINWNKDCYVNFRSNMIVEDCQARKTFFLVNPTQYFDNKFDWIQTSRILLWPCQITWEKFYFDVGFCVTLTGRFIRTRFLLLLEDILPSWVQSCCHRRTCTLRTNIKINYTTELSVVIYHSVESVSLFQNCATATQTETLSFIDY